MVYFGIVENVNDPEQNGRVQVRVFPFYRDIKTDDLPWALVERSVDLGPTYKGGLDKSNLINGTQVTVEFLDQHMQQPLVRGILPRATDILKDEVYNPAKKVYKFLGGAVLEIEEGSKDTVFKFYDNLSNTIWIDNEGISISTVKDGAKIHLSSGDNLQIDVEKDSTVTIKGNSTINVEGDSNVSVKGTSNVNVEGDCNIKSSGNASIEASKLSLKNINGTSQLCSLPFCLFTGAKHQNPSSD